MVRPKKIPSSALIISHKTIANEKILQLNDNTKCKNTNEKIIKKKSIEIDSENENKKKSNTTSKQTNKKIEEDEMVENNADELSGSKINMQTEQSFNEENVYLNESKFEMKERKRRKATLKKHEKIDFPTDIEIEKEPRKRRIASLNAEFLVHYCSSNNNAANHASLSSSLENKKTNSDNFSTSSKNEPKNSKRPRILSLESEHKSKIEKMDKAKLRKAFEEESDLIISSKQEIEENLDKKKKLKKKFEKKAS